jgi:hypothetical protein
MAMRKASSPSTKLLLGAALALASAAFGADSRFRQASLPDAATASASARPSATPSQRSSKREKDTMTSLQLIPMRPLFSPGEPVVVHVRIVNNGAQAIELPHPSRTGSRQPLYTIAGPGFASPKSFSPASLVSEHGDEELVAAAQPVTIRVEPHSTWEEPLEHLRMLELSREGEYQMSFRYQLPGHTLQSPVATFRIGRFAPRDIAIGQGTLAGQGAGVYTLPFGQELGLYSCLFREARADIGEAETRNVRSRGSVPVRAQDFLVADKNFPYLSEDHSVDVIVWREQRTLHVDSAYMPTPASFDLGLDVAYLARPMLKTQGGPFEILAVSKDEKQLALATLALDKDGVAKSLTTAWRYAVPERPMYPTIALASSQQPDRRDVAFAATHTEGTMVYHGSYTRGATLTSLQTTLLPGMRLLGAFPLSLSIDPSNGHALVSLLVAGPATTALSLVDLEYEQPAGPPGKPKVYRFRSFPGHPAAGSVFHTFPEGQPRRKVVVVVNDRNEVYAMKRIGKLIRQQPSLAPARPLSVLAGRNIDYLLYAHPERGLLLEPIHN